MAQASLITACVETASPSLTALAQFLVKGFSFLSTIIFLRYFIEPLLCNASQSKPWPPPLPQPHHPRPQNMIKGDSNPLPHHVNGRRTTIQVVTIPFISATSSMTSTGSSGNSARALTQQSGLPVIWGMFILRIDCWRLEKTWPLTFF